MALSLGWARIVCDRKIERAFDFPTASFDPFERFMERVIEENQGLPLRCRLHGHLANVGFAR